MRKLLQFLRLRLSSSILLRRHRTLQRRLPLGFASIAASVEYLESRRLLSSGTFITLTPPGAVPSYGAALGISGNVVVGQYSAAGGFQSFEYNASTNSYTSLLGEGALAVSGNNVVIEIPFGPGVLYNGSTYITLDPTGTHNPNVTATAVSGNNVVGIYNDGSVGRGFLYNASTSAYITFNVPGAASTVPESVSGSQVVGEFYTTPNGTNHGFSYDSVGKSFVTVDPPGSTYTLVNGISGTNIVGDYQNGVSTYGFLFDGSHYVTLAPPGTAAVGGSIAKAIDGNLVVGAYVDAAGTTHGYVYNITTQTYSTIDVPGSIYTALYAISGGSVAGLFQATSGGPFQAFVDIAPQSLPQLVLTAAHTTDLKSVVVNYTVSQTSITAPLRFDVYRSDQPSLDVSSVLLGGQTIDPASDSQDLAVGAHAVTLLNGTPLPSVSATPYIVVVADGDNAVTEAPGSTNVAAFVDLPSLKLAEATTTDAHSVTVTYAIGNEPILAPLTFDIYRSDQTTIDSKSVQIGSEVIFPSTGAGDLSVGPHTVQMISGIALPPNQALPNIVVVADQDGSVAESPDSVNTTYFQTWLIGAVVHGLDFANTVPQWETDMRTALLADKYDDVIPFDWATASHLPSAGEAISAGIDLYNQVVADAGRFSGRHLGDVVDLHFIGHSRGTVVISQALILLSHDVDPALDGSYIAVTLLDPHPANNGVGTGVGPPTTKKGELFSYGGLGGPLAAAAVRAFQSAADDPQVVIPADVRIGAVEVYYQQTAVSKLSVRKNGVAERQVNLWGEGPLSGIVDNSHAAIQWHSLTDVKDPTLGTIGHSEVPLWYDIHVAMTNSTLTFTKTTAGAGIQQGAVEQAGVADALLLSPAFTQSGGDNVDGGQDGNGTRPRRQKI